MPALLDPCVRLGICVVVDCSCRAQRKHQYYETLALVGLSLLGSATQHAQGLIACPLH
jgi:hypothetical protein